MQFLLGDVDLADSEKSIIAQGALDTVGMTVQKMNGFKEPTGAKHTVTYDPADIVVEVKDDYEVQFHCPAIWKAITTEGKEYSSKATVVGTILAGKGWESGYSQWDDVSAEVVLDDSDGEEGGDGNLR